MRATRLAKEALKEADGRVFKATTLDKVGQTIHLGPFLRPSFYLTPMQPPKCSNLHCITQHWQYETIPCMGWVFNADPLSLSSSPSSVSVTERNIESMGVQANYCSTKDSLGFVLCVAPAASLSTCRPENFGWLCLSLKRTTPVYLHRKFNYP